MVAHVVFLPPRVKRSGFSTPMPTFVSVVALVTGVKWNLIGVSVCISLVSEVESHSPAVEAIASWLFAHLLWRNVYF